MIAKGGLEAGLRSLASEYANEDIRFKIQRRIYDNKSGSSNNEGGADS
jgi:hypothetical protein